MPGLAHKRSPGSVLLGTGTLADEHHTRFRVTFAEDNGLALFAEPAQGAFGSVGG